MKLIVGLGNAKEEYLKTRHNVGWQVVLKLAMKHSVKINRKHTSGRRLLAVYGDWKTSKGVVRLFLPQTMMNLSGESFAGTQSWQVPRSDTLVVYDDVNLSIGTLRMRAQGSDGGHHGLASCISALESINVPRLRVGIGREVLPEDLTEFVLMPFEDDERQTIDKALAQAVSACELWAKEGIQAAMNTINPRERK